MVSRATAPTDTGPGSRIVGVWASRWRASCCAVRRRCARWRSIIPIWPAAGGRSSATGIIGRWTDGAAVLPLPAMRGDAMLEVHLAGTMTFVEDAARAA